MKVLIVFFSGTGNTKIVSQAISDQFRRNGHSVVLRSIEEQNPFSGMDDFDIVGFGFPVYAWRPPELFTDILEKSLPLGMNKPCFVFNTRAIASWRANHYVGKVLKVKGYNVMHTADFTAPPNDWMVLFDEDSRLVKRYVRWGESTWQDIENFAVAVLQNSTQQDDSIPVKLTGAIASGPLHHVGICLLSIVGRHWSLDRGRCTRCGLCISKCPSSNIGRDGDGFPIWGRDCALCFRCVNRCPEGAILLTSLSRNRYRYSLSTDPSKGEYRVAGGGCPPPALTPPGIRFRTTAVPNDHIF